MGFEEDCQRWRDWARSSVDGTETQRAAAGDAAAITGLLGGVEDGDSVAAAQAAAERFSTPNESADRVRDWISASLPIQTPTETWRRLSDSGWFAVPLHGLRFAIAETEPVFATSSAERWVWGQVQQKKGAAEKTAKEATKWLGVTGTILGAVVDSVGDRAREKAGPTPNAWHLESLFQYVLTDQRVLRLIDKKWDVVPFDHVLEVTTDVDEGAIRIKFANNTWHQYRLQNAELQSRVLFSTIRRYLSARDQAATAALRSKASSADPNEAAKSALALARKLRDKGDLEAAATNFEMAAKSPQAKTATTALWDLAQMWSLASQWDRSKDAFMRAIQTSEEATVPALLCNLAIVEGEAGHYDAALATLHRAIEANDPIQSTRALYLAGNLYDEQLNNATEAKRFYNQAMLSANDKWSSWAALYCGLMLCRGGDVPRAAAALHQAATRSDDKACMGQAMFELGKLYMQAARTDIGHTYLEQATASGSAKWEGEARKLLIETEQASQPSTGEPVAPPMQQQFVREAASAPTPRGGRTEAAQVGHTAADLPVVDLTATFKDQCEKWRLWAVRELAGSELQIAAAGDAAALTGLLGGTDANDFVAAARLAASCYSSELSSAAIAVPPPDAVPFESPESTFKRLVAAGWQPVALHGHNLALGDEQLFVKCPAEDWLHGSGEQKKHRGTEVAGDAVGELAGGFIGGIVGGVIGAAVAGAQMDADAEVKWRHVGSCEYLLTDRQILRLTTHSSKVNRFETIRVLLSHNDGGIVIRFMDYSAIMLRMQNWLLHQLVLEHMWRVYHDLPLFPPSRQQAVVGQSQTPAATPTVTPTGPPG